MKMWMRPFALAGLVAVGTACEDGVTDTSALDEAALRADAAMVAALRMTGISALAIRGIKYMCESSTPSSVASCRFSSSITPSPYISTAPLYPVSFHRAAICTR